MVSGHQSAITMSYMRNVFLVDFIEMVKVSNQSEKEGTGEKRTGDTASCDNGPVFGFYVNSQ